MDEASKSFRAVAVIWYEKFKNSWSEDHARRKWMFLEKDIFPILGNVPIKNISPKELLSVLDRIQSLLHVLNVVVDMKMVELTVKSLHAPYMDSCLIGVIYDDYIKRTTPARVYVSGL